MLILKQSSIILFKKTLITHQKKQLNNSFYNQGKNQK